MATSSRRAQQLAPGATERKGRGGVNPNSAGHELRHRAVCLTALSRRPKLSLFLAAAVLLVGFIGIQSRLPLGTAIQIGADEGFELAKAQLCLSGYKLYAEAWNDQPPLHTFLLSFLVKCNEGRFERSGFGLRHSLSSALDVKSAREWYGAPTTRTRSAGIVQPSHNVLWPRLLTNAFTLLLLTSFFSIIHRTTGLLTASMATGILILSPGFVELSCSCMLEIPALAMATCAIALLVCCPKTNWNLWETFAGVLFGLGLLIKLVPVILLPLVILIIWGKSGQENVHGHFQALLQLLPRFVAFALALLLAFVGTDMLIERGAFLVHFQQSWASHFGAARSSEYGSADEHLFDWWIFVKNWDITIPATAGILLGLNLVRGPVRRSLFVTSGPKASQQTEHSGMLQRPEFSIWLPFLWLAVTLAVFPLHKPWWPYYYIHFAAPLSWWAAFAILETIRITRRLGTATIHTHRTARVRVSRVGLVPKCLQGGILSTSVLTLFLLSILAWQAGRVYLQVKSIRNSPQTFSSMVLAEIQVFKPYATCMYADAPIYSFYAGIPMPPQLAVVPLKRLWSGEMTNARISEIMERSRPGIILLGNQVREVPFQALLASEYQLRYQDSAGRLFVHRSIANKARSLVQDP